MLKRDSIGTKVSEENSIFERINIKIGVFNRHLVEVIFGITKDNKLKIWNVEK